MTTQESGTLHLISQPPSQWQGLFECNTAFLNKKDAIILLGNACAAIHSQERDFMSNLQSNIKNHNLSVYVLQTDQKKYGLLTAMLPSWVSVISYHDWHELCVKAHRVITW